MNETMELIHRLADERLTLWRLAGKQSLTSAQQNRISEITNQLPLLWDRYRRELALSRWSRRDVPFEERRAA